MRVAKTVGWVVLALTIVVAGGAFAQTPPAGIALRSPSFPKAATGNPAGSEPLLVDLGLSGGRKSIVFGTAGRKLYVFNFDGTIAPGWPKDLAGEVRSSPAVADLGGGNGSTDIVVGFGGGGSDLGSVGGVAAFRRDGTQIWIRIGVFNPAEGFPVGVLSTPAIGDVDGDGNLEVVWGSLDARIYVVDAKTGIDKPNWPLYTRDTVYSSPTLYDIDGDGLLEIVIGTDTHADPTANPPGVPPTIKGGRLHVLRWDATEVFGFPKDVDEVIISSPVVGDIDGDGRPEIVHGTGTYYSIAGGAVSSKKVYAWKCDGTAVPGWPVTVPGRVTGSPALANVSAHANGQMDVVVSDYDKDGPSGNQFHVSLISGSGTVLWTRTPIDFFGNNLGVGQPVVADVLGDGNLEVLVPTNWEVAIFNSAGTQLTDAGAPRTKGTLWAAGSVSGASVDVDNGVVTIVALGTAASNTSVYVWQAAGKSAAPPWGAFRHRARRDGFAAGSGNCIPRSPVASTFHTLPPCRVLDTRVGSGPLGGPALAPNAPRSFPVAGVCNIPLGAVAISANLTVTNIQAAGELVVYPADVSRPPTSSLSFRPGRTRANNALVYLSATTATFSVFNSCPGAVDFVLDVNGYFQ
ncbi:MAG: VCBS repeat-containing protein [Acidobacteriota bacterium]